EEQINTFGTTMGRAQGVMGGLKSAGGAVIDMLGGPWGMAIPAGALVLGDLIQQHQRAKERVDDLSASLKNGASAAEYFEDALSQSESSMYTEGFFNKLKNGFDSVWDAVDRVGIKHQQFIDAITGDQAAYDEIVTKVSDWYDSLNLWDQWWDSSGKVVLESMSEQQGNYQKALENTQAQEEAAQEAARQKTAALLEGADATGEYAAATGKAADADQILADQFGATTDGVNELASALTEVISALDTYYGFARSETDALLDLRSGYLDVQKAVKENGATLDTYTEKGISNRKALNDLASSAVKAAEAQAKNGRSVEEINGTLNEAHDRFVQYAQQMGASAEEAEKLAAASGLGKDAAKQLTDAIKDLDNTTAAPTIDMNVEAAQSKLGELASKTTLLPNGNVLIYGNNQPAMNQIAEVVGAKIDPKTGQITADKSQYDAILALANGATLDSKTGELKGDNSKYWASVCKANGWKIDTKTGVIKGDNGQALKAVNAVNNKKVLDKYFTVSDNGTAQLNIDRVSRLDAMQISNKTYTITEMRQTIEQGVKSGSGTHLFAAQKARGGLIVGPGTGTSDSVPIWASAGEFMMTAAA
ncbi:MAG: hypothetical protein K2I40_08245, partial [Bifidobacterium castoris]|nr:hypothetical protein [Bifidobacterium castoris]